MSAKSPAHEIQDRCSQSVFSVSQSIAKIHKLANNPRNQSSNLIESQILETNEHIKAASASLQSLAVLVKDNPDDRQAKLAFTKLDKDLRSCLDRFKKETKNVAEKQRAYIHLAAASASAACAVDVEDTDESLPLLSNKSGQPVQQQESLLLRQLDNQIDFNEALITERDSDLKEIEQSITQVNEIFRDLGTLVNEQGHMMDNIENNIDAVVINMEGATGELRHASEYQKKVNRRWWCLTIVIGIIIIIFLAVLL